MQQVTLYVTKSCGYCHAAETLLLKKGISYVKHDISLDHEKRAQLIEQTNHRTVPLIFIDGVFIGGYQELSLKVK